VAEDDIIINNTPDAEAGYRDDNCPEKSVQLATGMEIIHDHEINGKILD